MKRFGIDIDGTVTSPESLLPHINDYFDLQLTLHDITQYELTKVLDISPEVFGNWFKKAEPEIYKHSPLAQGAKEILDDWKEHHELFFISARPSELLQLTKEWFDAKDLMYHHIELIGSHNKLSTAKKHDVDIFFEDKHDNAVMIHEELNIPVVLFDTPYNQQPIPDGVIRVNDWQEANQWVNRWLRGEK
ncbi:hypothetical protein LCM10_07610 [Rossellomorea aquimaris]|uniref:5' nucleotidase, NT5C type n=1 Tax=Rossellomorea aquimaris TaxID=189382 RepID=UPI001CD28207|nr:hypothetical protein [Rossellomorea aquimaris]MCA1054852.1 hypothetical protein [Rossellomorea aquimaris]